MTAPTAAPMTKSPSLLEEVGIVDLRLGEKYGE
jgi:hypothetical protein